MKRSGSKLIATAGRVKNLSKSGYRFDVSLAIESADNLLGTSDVVCTWERGRKVLSTPPCSINKRKRTVDFDDAAMRQEITLFKKKKADAGFEQKVFRLAVRQRSETGRVVGKVDLDFAQFADLPSFSERIVAPLSSGGRLILRVETRCLGEKKGEQSVSGSSSTYSYSTLEEQDLGDLGLPPYGDEDSASRVEVERLRVDNRALQQEVVQLRKRLADGGGGGGQDEEVLALTEENANLRKGIAELEARISREPVYGDIVRQLRESKMALAILTMERDELHQAVRINSGVGGGGGGISSRKRP